MRLPTPTCARSRAGCRWGRLHTTARLLLAANARCPGRQAPRGGATRIVAAVAAMARADGWLEARGGRCRCGGGTQQPRWRGGRAKKGVVDGARHRRPSIALSTSAAMAAVGVVVPPQQEAAPSTSAGPGRDGALLRYEQVGVGAGAPTGSTPAGTCGCELGGEGGCCAAVCARRPASASPPLTRRAAGAAERRAVPRRARLGPGDAPHRQRAERALLYLHVQARRQEAAATPARVCDRRHTHACTPPPPTPQVLSPAVAPPLLHCLRRPPRVWGGGGQGGRAPGAPPAWLCGHADCGEGVPSAGRG